jgi:prolyl-tRNA synthetase
MLQSKLFTKTERAYPKDEEAISAKLLIRAGFVDKLMAGVYTFLPLGLRVLKKIENVIREEINLIEGQEVFMPALQPKEIWALTGRWNTMTDLYKLKDSSDREFVLGPTHEEVIAPLLQRFVNSYKDLPTYVYQFQSKFRMELRSKGGLLRGREFLMKDLYSFHLVEKDLDDYYERAKGAYFKIFERVGIKEKTHLTFASGGTFSKYSHEFQTITPAGEDLIYVCEGCGLAVNKEIKSEVQECPGCASKDFREEKAIEVGNIFKLQDKYTKPFGFRVTDSDGSLKDVLMGCYGIGLSRLMATVVEILNDEKGMSWPKEIAPFRAHLIVLDELDGNIVYKHLNELGIETLYDDRVAGAGEKFADSDLIGIPYRVVVSKKTGDKFELKERNSKEVKLVSWEELVQILQK